MIRILLKDEQDPTTLAVCAHDVGEYVRHYPVVSILVIVSTLVSDICLESRLKAASWVLLHVWFRSAVLVFYLSLCVFVSGKVQH